MGVELELKREREGGQWSEREERCMKERRKEASNQKKKKILENVEFSGSVFSSVYS